MKNINNTNSKITKHNAKLLQGRKFLGVLLVLGVLFSSLLLLTACGTEQLSTPTNLELNTIYRELTWDHVLYSTGGYTIEIHHIQSNTTTQHHGYANGFSLALTTLPTQNRPGTNLTTPGTYLIRVRALTVDRNFFRNSNWSNAIEFVLDDPMGLQFRRINNNTEYEVSGRAGTGTLVTIPDIHNGLPVTSIASRVFSGATNLNTLIIGNNVRRIESFAFTNATGITSITFGNSIEYIGDQAFAHNHRITSIVLPDSLVHIGNSAFIHARDLVNVTFGDSLEHIGNAAFRGFNSISNLEFPSSLRTIGNEAFATALGSNLLTPLISVIFNQEIEYIGNGAFFRSGITALNIEGSGNTIISAEAFRETRNLTTVSLGAGIASVGNGAFFASGVTGFNILGNGSTTIGTDAFRGSLRLSSINIGDGVTLIGLSAFRFTGIVDPNSVSLGNGVTTIMRWAFADTLLFNNQVGNGAVYIDNWLVGYLRESLPPPTPLPTPGPDESPMPPPENPAATTVPPPEYLIIRPGTRGVADWALDNQSSGIGFNNITRRGWYDLNNIVKIVFPASIRHIGFRAFVHCAGVTEVQFMGEGLLTIDDFAFWGASELAAINLPNTVNSIGFSTFTNTAIWNSWNIAQQGNVVYVGRWAVGLRVPPIMGTPPAIPPALPSITLRDDTLGIASGVFEDSGVTTIILNNGLRYIGNFAFRRVERLTSITIPNSVIRIGRGAFLRARNLSTAVLSNSITAIENYTFFRAESLTGIVIPNSVTSIGSQAFYMAAQLATVTFEQGSRLTTIEDNAFFGNLYLSNIILPDTLISIGDHAFRNSVSLTNITFGNSLQHIGSNAFRGIPRLGINGGLNLPQSLTHIGSQAFMGLQYITELIIPSNVRYLGNEAFRDVIRLESVVIEYGLTHIGSGAFMGASSLTSITIPNSIISIGRYAFRNLTSLEQIIIPISVLIMGEHVFVGSGILNEDDVSQLKLLVEAPARPARWHGSWNSSGHAVEWGFIRN